MTENANPRKTKDKSLAKWEIDRENKVIEVPRYGYWISIDHRSFFEPHVGHGRDDLYHLPFHVAEKMEFDFDSFELAYRKAIRDFGLQCDPDALDVTLIKARRQNIRSREYSKAFREVLKETGHTNSYHSGEIAELDRLTRIKLGEPQP